MTKPVLLVRATDNERDAAALRALGFEVVAEPYLSIGLARDAVAAGGRLLETVGGYGEGDWVIASSANGLRFWGEAVGLSALRDGLMAAAARGVKFAAVGEATAKLYSVFGIDDVLVSAEPYGFILGAAVAQTGAAARALVPAGNLALTGLRDTLEAAGWAVTSEVVYETTTVSNRPESAPGLAAGEFAAVVLRSPSAARAVARWASPLPASLIAVCGGQTTAAEAQAQGFAQVAIAEELTPEGIANAVALQVRGA